MEYRIIKSDELYHYGVKGQKWGVRRYKNKDGSLTKAGKNRNEVTSSKTIFDDLKSDFRIRIKDGTLRYGYTTETNIGTHKKVPVNLVMREKDMQSKSAKLKSQKAQKFINDLEKIESNSNIKGKLQILDIDIDNNLARALYSSGRINIEMSTHRVIH